MDIATFWSALVIGIVEGVTEFLPISSTGHIVLAEHLLHFKTPPGKIFEVSIQLGAVAAILWLYAKRLIGVLIAAPKDPSARRFLINVFLALLPAGILGALGHKVITDVLFHPIIVALSFITGGIGILLAEWAVRHSRYDRIENIPAVVALAIGFCQALALIPGISRSGASIMGALLMGTERRAATEFSFFLAIPTLGGAALLNLWLYWDELKISDFDLIAVGFVGAFVTSIFVVRGLLAFISHHSFAVFAWYRIVVGAAALWWLL